MNFMIRLREINGCLLVHFSAVTYRRNSSLTKGEIEAYWRKKRTTEEEHLRAISGSLDAPQV